MSYEDDESLYDDYDQQKQKELFRYDTSLIRSVEVINSWNQNLSLGTREYLRVEAAQITRSYNMFSCGVQIRAVAFCKALDKGFQDLADKYKKTYSKLAQEDYDIEAAIKQLDLELSEYLRHLHIVETNNITVLYDQIKPQGVNSLYTCVRQFVDYCFDLNTLWLLLLTPRMFRQEQKDTMYKHNYGGTLLYYQKQLTFLQERIKRTDVNNFCLHPPTLRELLRNIQLILGNEKMKPTLKTKIISLLKGQHYAAIKKTLKQDFIVSTLQMYNGEELSELWDHEKFQDLCIQVLKKSIHDQQYLDCAMYMEPESISFERRRHTFEFAQIYYSIIHKIIHLEPTHEMLEHKDKMIDAPVEISLKYLQLLMRGENFQLVCHLFINFLISNKNALSMNTPELDKLLFGMLDGIKKIYLSFGSQKWMAPNSALSALTNRFFNKFSEQIKPQVVSLLPNMVKHLESGKLPTIPKIVISEQESQLVKKIEHISVSERELLQAIFYYIKDAEYKDQDFYLDLPQITPSSMESFIMFIRSLELKLRHHEPSEEQKKLWIMIIEESVAHYKIKINLKWFKQKKKLEIQEREAEFNIQKQIKEKWAFDIVQDALNFRDEQLYQELANNASIEVQLENEIIGYFKYAIGLKINASSWSSNIAETELFLLLDKMRATLDINFGNVFSLSPDETVTLNELHLCLMFYNSKVQEAKGNQVYMLIVHRIIIPWYEYSNKLQCEQFEQRFQQFFVNFISKQYYIVIGDSIITLLVDRTNKENLQYKLGRYYQDLNKDAVSSNTPDANAEFLQKIYSVLDDSIQMDILVQFMLLVIKFMDFVPQLEDQYISLGFFVQYINSKAKLDKFLKKTKELAYSESLRINFELIKKLPEKMNDFSFEQILEIINTHIESQQDSKDPSKLMKVLENVSVEKENLMIAILKTLVAQRNKQKLPNLSPQAQRQQQIRTFKYWKQLEDYAKKNEVERKSDQEEINLAKICQLFEDTVFKKLKQDYKKILQVDYKKKRSSKKKSSGLSKGSDSDRKEEEDKPKDVEFEDKFKEAKIWRKIVKNFGTFQDIILFGEDPLEIIGAKQEEIFDKCLKIVRQKTIQQKYLKRIIRKLPILQRCAEDAVKIAKKNELEGTEKIQPQLILKLIMINSRYRSKIVQEFILQNLSKIPVPLKIYQDYLVLDVKKKVEALPKHMIDKMLFGQLSENDMKKIDEAFDKIIYIPIKKYQNIYLKFDNKIEENEQAENQEWETESEGDGDNQANQDDQDIELQKKQSKNNKKSLKQQNKNEQQSEEAQMDDENLDDELDDSNQDSIEENSDEYDDEEGDGGENHDQIVTMFYAENDKNLPKYKQFIQLRQEVNMIFKQNYLSYEQMQKKIKEDPQLQKKMFKIVDILENELSQEITKEILNKIPNNLYKLLKLHGLTRQRIEERVENYRKETTKMPRFINQEASEQEDNSNDEDEQNYEEDAYNDDDDLSSETASENDMFDGLGDQLMFVISEDGHLEHINAEELMKNEQPESDEQERESEEIKVTQDLQKQADDTLSLPQLKQINSKIETELTGKQLSADDMVRVMEVAIIKLFSLSIYQLKQKPVLNFYCDLINCQQGKIFVDTIFTVLRVDELYSDEERLKLAKKLLQSELSISKAVNSLLEVLVDIETEDSKEGHALGNLIREQVRSLLPIGDEIMLKSDIPIQDNFLTLLVFYSRYNKNSIHDKIKKLLSSLSEDGKNVYQLSKAKATILTKHIYNNSNASAIWDHIEEKFGIKIETKVKFNSCLTVYGRLLRQDIEKCYNDLLQIVKVPMEVHNQEEKTDAKLLIKQQEKKVEQNLRKHFKRIKHYYYWNKRNILNQLEGEEEDALKKSTGLLKNQELIKLTQLMIFYCHFLKQKFFEKIGPSAMKNLLVLPKSIIQASFMFLWKLEANIDKWEPLSKVKQYFKSFKLYEHKFNRLEQVCNLVLEFLEMPQFSNSKFKEVIIPYFINHRQIAQEVPLIFKLPDIPENLNGQKVYLTRQCSFDMSFYQLAAKSILVEFHNEEGSDHGGMVREFMMGWSGKGIGEEHIFIGKILAISFKKSIPYGGQFDMGMAVAITQHQVTLQFMEQVEPEVAKSLKYIKQSDPEDLDMKFEITKLEYGEIKHYPLKPNGEQIAVTNENKEEYLKLFLENYYRVGREWQISEICTGFFSIVNRKYAAIFSPFEMIQKIQGEEINDYNKLKNKTKYEQGYTESSQIIKWFWQIVSEFNQKQMNRFLQFITGAPKVSIYNHNFSFVIEKPYTEDEQRLPVAHTCFNTLELPEYKTKEILAKKLTQAVFEGNDSFGIL